MVREDQVVPDIELHNFDESCLRVLRNIQKIILKHPIVCQAVFSALISEGEKFAATPEGRTLKTTIEGSSVVQQLQYLIDLSTFSVLERNPPDVLPSTYIDTLFMLANSDEFR